MIKKRLLIFGFILCAMALAVPSVASAATYDGFTATLHEAYEGEDWTNNPPLSCGVGTQITNPTELAKLNHSDDDRISHSSGGSYDYHEFKFKIDEGVWSIAQISMLHEGYGTGGHSLYIWNYNTASWEIVSSTLESGLPDKILTGIRNSGFYNYIQGGYLQLLAIASETDVDTIYTDYVKVEITEEAPAAVPNLSQWGMIGMTIVLAAALVWSVRKRWVISAGKS